MFRTTARALLLFFLCVTFAPLAQALVPAPPPHACCLRKTHSCHEQQEQSTDAEFRSKDCCRQDCCKTATFRVSKSLAPLRQEHQAHAAVGLVFERAAGAPALRFSSSCPARAPPSISLD